MSLSFGGQLKGHTGAITRLVCRGDGVTKLISASQDNDVRFWVLPDEENAAPLVLDGRLHGHSETVSDIALSKDCDYLVSASWDKTLRLWNLRDGKEMCKFEDHTKDVLTCAFSADNRQILSGGRDNKIKVWNVMGECVFTIEENSHTDWVSCIRFSPSTYNPVFVSGGWDNLVKVWSLTDFKCLHTFTDHTDAITSVTISPDGSLCASASKDRSVILWDLAAGEKLYALPCDDVVNDVIFSPTRYWFCAATDSGIRVFDLENKSVIIDLKAEGDDPVACTSVAWSADGTILYGGYKDKSIRIWNLVNENSN